MRGPELRAPPGWSRPGLGSPSASTSRPVAPPPLGKHLAGALADYDAIGGDDLHYTEVAQRLDVDPRTVLRWRALRRGISLA